MVLTTQQVYRIESTEVDDVEAQTDEAVKHGWLPSRHIFREDNDVTDYPIFYRLIKKDREEMNKDDEYLTHMYEWRSV